MHHSATLRAYALLGLLPGGPQMRMGIPSASPSTDSNRPTANATRYDDILAVVANRTVCLFSPGPGVSDITRPFEIAVRSLSVVTAMSKVALNAGSSKEGKARRASVASNWVTAYLLPSRS